MSHIFDSLGKLARKGCYADIKKAKEEYPDSWAVKAAMKLWTLAFVDNAEYMIDAEEAKAERERIWKERQEKAEAERKAREDAEKAAAISRWSDLLTDALALVNVETSDLYRTLVGKDLAAENVISFECRGFDKAVGLHLEKCPFYISIKAEETPSAERLAAYITRLVNHIAEDKKSQTNFSIDVFKDQPEQNTYASAILKGVSGTLYYITLNATSKSSSVLYVSRVGLNKGPREDIRYLDDMPEDYEVIYTHVSVSDNNNRTYKNSYGWGYTSWASSEQADIADYIPAIGDHEGNWSNTKVIEVKNPSGKYFSKMDKIDTWTQSETVSYSTD